MVEKLEVLRHRGRGDLRRIPRRQGARARGIRVLPGRALSVIAAWVLARRAYERYVEPVIADMQQEYLEATVAGRAWRARWVAVRGHLLIVPGGAYALVSGALRGNRFFTPRTRVGLYGVLGIFAILCLPGRFADTLSALQINELSREEAISTRVGEQRSIVPAGAPDSTITLNTNSSIKVRRLGSGVRVDVLRGEVLFDLHPNPRRQLIVYLGNVTVVDTGTVFVTQITDDGQIRVTVQEGQVRVLEPGMPETVLSQNEQALAHYKDPVVEVQTIHLSPEEVMRSLSWRRGELSVYCGRVADVVYQLNRYNLTKIEVSDHDVGNVLIGGLFSLRDPAGFVHAITALDPDVLVEPATTRDGTRVLRLRRGSLGAAPLPRKTAHCGERY